MTKKVVLDASALLALINQEPGADVVEDHLPQAIMSSVNIAEVATVLQQIGIPIQEIKSLINSLIERILPFDNHHAFVTASLREKTKALGLSLGDRACLSLGKIEDALVVTADKTWGKLDLAIHIQVIR